MPNLLLVCMPLLLLSPPVAADTHYVSHGGSNTPPYESWATATDSILLAIRAASDWDTVLLAAGVFTADSLPLSKGMAFIGAGMDSTKINHNGNFPYAFILSDSCLIEGVYLKGKTQVAAAGTGAFLLVDGAYASTDESAIIRGNRFTDMEYPVTAIETDKLVPSKRVVVENNEFSNFFEAVYTIGSAKVLGNRFLVDYNDIGSPVKALFHTAEIRNNVFIRTVSFSFPAIELYRCDSIWVANNICLSALDTGTAIRINPQDIGYPTRGVIENNLCLGGWSGILSYGGDIHIRNNIIERTTIGALYYDTLRTAPGHVGYNLFWENLHLSPSDMAFRPDPGNLFANPMFVDSMDFHLQAFSPAIDAGDPSLLDADGSRSDIGPYGGPYGETYVYQDLAPAPPRGLEAQWQDTGAAIRWGRSSEADLAGYRLYRDSFPIAFPDPQLLLIEPMAADTAYIDTSEAGDGTIYYRLTAVDGQGHESALSNEVLLSASSVPEVGTLPDRFVLYPAYPNPFNSSTVVPFAVPEPAYSTIVVYNVLGRPIRTLAEQSFATGTYTLSWDGTDDQSRPVASGVYFIVSRTGPDLQVRKAVLLK